MNGVGKLLSLLVITLLGVGTLYAGNSCDYIIPRPQSITAMSGSFVISKESYYSSDSRLPTQAISYLQQHLRRAAGYKLKQAREKSKSSIRFLLNTKQIKRAEGYRLAISQSQVVIQARDKAGFFYAVVSLMQLMNSAIWSKSQKRKVWEIPTCIIMDYPHYEWRGMMLDSARNFFSVAYVKKFIDRMAQHKLNRFHWHLSDDEGWRIAIGRYPLLTKVGAKRGPGTKLPFSTFPAMRGAKNRVQSGHYTQGQIRDIVAFAKARSIEILPEIDMPAHAKALVVAYPSLLLDPKDKSSFRSVQKIANNAINPAKESSYSFIDGVFSELVKLFPFGYIHVGGDEVPKGSWSRSPAVKNLMKKNGFRNSQEVENYFFSRVDKIARKHHRKLVGWQELMNAQPKIRKSSVIMAWKSPKAYIKASKKGYKSILSPVQYLYFDQRYSKAKGEYGHTWSTPISTKKLYSYRPSSSRYIQGVQANLWSETLLNTNIADYLSWPRALALAEVAWTEPRHRKWSEFKQRAYGVGVERLEVQGVRHRR